MKKRIFGIVMALTMLFSLFPFSALPTVAAGDGEELPLILYEESFDGVQEQVLLSYGLNYSGAAAGWIYEQNTFDGSAYIKDGRMYLSGNDYDVVYRDGGQSWGNYILEADFCYTEDNTGWGGMLYNVQSGEKFQKVGISLTGSATVNGYDGDWTNNSSSLNQMSLKSEGLTIPQNGDPFRMKVVVENKTASFYYAMLSSDGSMQSDFIFLKQIDNIPANAQTGSIGFMTSGGMRGSFWVDNIKCYSYDTVSYTENFDSYGDLTLTANAEQEDIGIRYVKNYADGTAYLQNGKLYLSGGGKNFDAIFFTMGEHWTNYTVEADMTYPKAETGWAGLLYRSTDIDHFQKGTVSPAKRVCLNGQLDGAWYRDGEGVTKKDYPAGEVALGVASRLRIEVEEGRARLYIAYYGEEGELGAYQLALEINDTFASEHMSGTVGLIVGGADDAKTSEICIDNLTVRRGTDRMSEPPAPVNAAILYEPQSGIVNPPVVVQHLHDSLPQVTGERAAVVMAEVDAQMNLLGDGGAILSTAAAFIDTYRTCLIPAFIIDSEEEAAALADLIEEKDLIDCYVMAAAEDAALVRSVRMDNDTTKKISGALIFEDLNTKEARQGARAAVADNMCYVAISKAPLTQESAHYFNVRQIGAWSYAADTQDIYAGIANGNHGLIAADTGAIYHVYESITETTVSGKPVIVAHRGANKAVSYPENTVLGGKAAIEEYGADALEIDLRITKDGYLYIMHDPTLDRTTNGTGNGADLTLEEIRNLEVDEISFRKTVVPTFDEMLQLVQGTDIVLYCHMNIRNDTTVSAFSHLVEKYGCQDNVIFFGAYDSRTNFHSNNNRTYTGGAYGLDGDAVMADGIVFTAGDKAILSDLKTVAEGVVAMKEGLTPHNYQALFYKYSNQGKLWAGESFYYNLSARGFVNIHSITNGQSVMDKTALTQSGAVGFLTDDIDLCDDYHYAIVAENETLESGQVLNIEKVLRLTKGTLDFDCGFEQLEGPTLIKTEDGYTLAEPGTVTLVWYADRRTNGRTQYRVYSEPVEITFTPSTNPPPVLDPEQDPPAGDNETGDQTGEDQQVQESTNALPIVIAAVAAVAVAGAAAAILLVRKKRRS